MLFNFDQQLDMFTWAPFITIGKNEIILTDKFQQCLNER